MTVYDVAVADVDGVKLDHSQYFATIADAMVWGVNNVLKRGERSCFTVWEVRGGIKRRRRVRLESYILSDGMIRQWIGKVS